MTKKQKSSSVFRIQGELTIYRAAALKQELMEFLDENTSIDIDLSEVSEFDSAGIQILLLAKKTALSKEKNLRLVEHSTPVLEGLEPLNLSAYFGDPLFIPSKNI